MKQAPLIISLAALLGVVVLFLQDAGAVRTPRTYAPIAPPAMEDGRGEAVEDHIEVAIVMGHIQRFHQKFWLALRAGNQELALFYLHEMEEAMEEIADAGINEDGVDLSANMRTYGLGVVEHLQETIKNEGLDAAHREADLLVNSCNSCHKASGYDLIRIRVPLEFSIPDQDMAPAIP